MAVSEVMEESTDPLAEGAMAKMIDSEPEPESTERIEEEQTLVVIPQPPSLPQIELNSIQENQAWISIGFLPSSGQRPKFTSPSTRFSFLWLCLTMLTKWICSSGRLRIGLISLPSVYLEITRGHS